MGCAGLALLCGGRAACERAVFVFLFLRNVWMQPGAGAGDLTDRKGLQYGLVIFHNLGIDRLSDRLYS